MAAGVSMSIFVLTPAANPPVLAASAAISGIPVRNRWLGMGVGAVQYVGIFGSTSCAQALMPPTRLLSRVNPARSRKYATCWLRTP